MRQWLWQVNGLDKIRDLVLRFRDSPLTAGYWIKDDDCTDTGDEQVALIGLYNLVRSLDPNPQHYIVPGFGDAGSIARNYAHGCCDLIGFYPIRRIAVAPRRDARHAGDGARPHARWPDARALHRHLSGLRLAGICRPVFARQQRRDQVATFIADGAVGIGGFGWNAPNESHIAANDKTLRDAVGAVTQWLITHGYGTK